MIEIMPLRESQLLKDYAAEAILFGRGICHSSSVGEIRAVIQLSGLHVCFLLICVENAT